MAVSAALALPGPASGGPPAPTPITIREPITPPNNVFDPETPPVKVINAQGTGFRWQREPTAMRLHNVLQDDRLFYSGAPTAQTAFLFERTASAGTIHYYCETHGSPSAGMQGVIRVRPQVPAHHMGDPFTVAWANSATNIGSAFDVQFMVEGSDRWRVWRNDTQAFQGAFGNNDRPVNLRPGRTYRFRARTEKSVQQPDKKSDWSPTATASP